jgi:hypothetical protein
MKYQFIKNGEDDYLLKYKDKEIHFNSNVDIAVRMQEVNKIARIKMIQDLGKAGVTIKELTKEIKKDGKTYYDNSNKEELEKEYIEEERSKVFNEVAKELLGMDFVELVKDIGITDEKEATKLGEEFGMILAGTFPSEK